MVKDLKEDQVSRPIPTSTGIYILKVISRKGRTFKPFCEIQEKLKIALMNERGDKAIKALLRKLRKDAVIRMGKFQ